MRSTQLIALLCFVLAALAWPSAASAQESGPGIRIAPAIRWPTRAPFGTTIRCPYSYVPDGDTVGTGSIDLASIRCGRSCNGWTYFQFGNLPAGTYEVRVTRNGDLAAETSFEVT